MITLKATTLEAQYSTLKSQMQPHFLFNALNSLTELIETDPQRAAKMAQMISDLYRFILNNSKIKTSSLESELSIARKYLEIEKVRLGDRLNFRIEAPENADRIFVPSLMLQTLLENAIKHGISKAVDGGEVVLLIEKAEGGNYRFDLVNSGAAFNPKIPKENNAASTGLNNTVSRLDLLYGNIHRFQMGIDALGKTAVSFYVTGEPIA